MRRAWLKGSAKEQPAHLAPRFYPREECGVFGIWGNPDAARLTYYGLYALQHRGQESAGIVTTDGGELRVHKGMGLVSEVFDDQIIANLSGSDGATAPSGSNLAAPAFAAAIGHVRYSTTGSSSLQNAQPLVIRHRRGEVALAHNGNLVNAPELRQQLEEEGSIFQTTIDTEVVAHLIAKLGKNGLATSVAESLRQVRGGYAFAFLTPNCLMAARDPHGIRPLSLGRLGDAWVVASETCAFDTIGAEFVRDVNPGELITIDADGMRSMQAVEAGDPHLCIFEYIYFARPDSDLNGRNVHAVRKELGRILAREHPAAADLVTGVPDSSLSAAAGYAEEAGLPYEVGLIKNRYIGRTFIQPGHKTRITGVRLKLNPLRRVVEGKRVVLVDDSIVRGTTSRHIVRLLRAAGAKEVHLRISSPPYYNSCHYGIDTSAEAELIARGRTLEEIEKYVEADSLRYISPEGMVQAVAGTSAGVRVDIDEGTAVLPPKNNDLPAPDVASRGALAGRDTRARQSGFCLACFTGEYPVEIDPSLDKYAFEKVKR